MLLLTLHISLIFVSPSVSIPAINIPLRNAGPRHRPHVAAGDPEPKEDPGIPEPNYSLGSKPTSVKLEGAKNYTMKSHNTPNRAILQQSNSKAPGRWEEDTHLSKELHILSWYLEKRGIPAPISNNQVLGYFHAAYRR